MANDDRQFDIVRIMLGIQCYFCTGSYWHFVMAKFVLPSQLEKQSIHIIFSILHCRLSDGSSHMAVVAYVIVVYAETVC